MNLSIIVNRQSYAHWYTVAVFVCFASSLTLIIGCSSEPTSEELAAIALGSGDKTEREEAASQLSMKGESALPLMIELLDKSDSPVIRSIAVGSLSSSYSYEHIEKLIDLIGDPAPEVQHAAFRAICRLLGTEFEPIPKDAPPEVRTQRIESIRKTYQAMKESGSLKNWIDRLKRKK